MIKKLYQNILIGILLSLALFTTTVFAQGDASLSTSSSDIQANYRTHVQNVGWEWDWVDDGDVSGTVGQGLRLEGIQIELTGDVPTGAKIEYRTQIQNEGWESEWTSDGMTSGTAGKGLRLEGIQIRLVNLPGYSVEYRTQVQNVGWEETWASDGETSGTVGQGLRLEAIQIKVVKSDESDLTEYDDLISEAEALHSSNYTEYSWDHFQDVLDEFAVTSKDSEDEVNEAIEYIEDAMDDLESIKGAKVYDDDGTYGSATTSSPLEIDGNVIIEEEDVRLRNMDIDGNLIIEAGDVILNNVDIDGMLIITEDVDYGKCTFTKVDVQKETRIRGGDDEEGIYFYSGDYSDIVIQETALDSTYIVTTSDSDFVIAEDAEGQTITIKGDCDSIDVNAFDVILNIEGSSEIQEMYVEKGAMGSTIDLDDNAEIDELYIYGQEISFTGYGTIDYAEVTGDGATFEIAPDELVVDDQVDVDPEVPIMVEEITVSGEDDVEEITEDGGTLQMIATIEPDDATNQDVTWEVENDTGEATIDSSGLLTALKNGTVTVEAYAQDGSGSYGYLEIEITNQEESTIAAESSTIANGEENPEVVITLENDTFSSYASTTSYWSIDTGDTGLTLSSITRDLSKQVTISFIGTAEPGTITIQAESGALTSGEDSNEIEVVVPTVSVTSVVISQTEMSLTAGGATGTLTATILPTNATNQNVSWSSQYESVATVSGGVVTPVSAGTTYIYVTTSDGSKVASCLVTVTD